MKNALCLDDNTIKINICMDQTLMLLDHVAVNISGNRDVVLRATCCAVQLGLDCFRSKIHGHCEKTVGANTSEYLSQKVDGMLSEVFDIACKKHQNLEVCDVDQPELMAELRQVIAAEEVDRQLVSPLIPLMKVVSKIKL